MTIKLILAGATGNMGQEVVRMLDKENKFTLLCGVSREHKGKNTRDVIGCNSIDAPLVGSIEEAFDSYDADVLVDFTTPYVVKKNTKLAIEKGISPVIGTSGLDKSDISDLNKLCIEKNVGGIVAPNFAIGAVLMMLFASLSAKYLSHFEIVESHHNNKLDAPSATAIKMAEYVSKTRKKTQQGHPEEKETIKGARGAYYDGFRIHSVRLPGLVAHHEALFGGQGEMLSIRHDSYNRDCFMPGVKIAIEKVRELEGLVYGLENVLDINI